MARTRMTNLFVYEEGDLENYPDSRFFLERHFTGEDLLGTFNDFRRKYGFFRKRNTAQEFLDLDDIAKRFPFNAILRVYYIRENLNALRVAEECAEETFNRFKDIPQEEFLNELNKIEEY